MKLALISDIEQIESGLRIVQVSEQRFDTTPHFFWVECDDAVAPETHFYDPNTKRILNIVLTQNSSTVPDGLLSPKTFMNWFSETEKQLLADKMPTDPKIHEFLDDIFSSVDKIVLTDPKFISGIEYLVSIGTISEARKIELLSNKKS